ncbi:DMT family transporter [Romboutsia sp. CE17]|uniref:DMT family transporter n=1 Tax=Romboutsia sp. CE17 TaxID=2724150 RepID=UPI001442AEE3|nr:DMT family transporter [Romboutsia sp. CE17]QJA09347.1 DMT family transporter [Romboutsia sp. CE17]
MKNTAINLSKVNGIGITSGVLSGILWGLDTVILGIILSKIPNIGITNAAMLAPLVGAFLHDTFSSLWMILFSITKKEFVETIKLLKTKSGKFVCLAALFGGPIGMAGYLLAINYIGSGYTASISAIYPAVGAFFSYIFLKEKLSIKGWIGLSLSILAVIILGYTPTQDMALNFGLGFGCALICVIGWSLESVICAYGMKDDEVSPTQALQLRQLVSAIVYGILIVPLFGGLGLTKVIITSNLTIMIAGVALIGTLSYIFYYTAIDTIGPVKATGLNISYSIWAIVFDMIFLGSSITPKLVLCSILIIVGSVMVSKN